MLVGEARESVLVSITSGNNYPTRPGRHLVNGSSPRPVSRLGSWFGGWFGGWLQSCRMDPGDAARSDDCYPDRSGWHSHLQGLRTLPESFE
jgi:hypothetical protein